MEADVDRYSTYAPPASVRPTRPCTPVPVSGFLYAAPANVISDHVLFANPVVELSLYSPPPTVTMSDPMYMIHCDGAALVLMASWPMPGTPRRWGLIV